MFGHTYNPNYFINPPAYTYLLHLAFALGFGGRDGVAEASPPTRATSSRSRARRRPCSARPPSGCWPGRARGCRPSRRPAWPRRCSRSPSCPCTAPLRAQRRPDAGAASASRWSASPASTAAAARVTRARRAGLGLPARPSTPAASCCCRCWRRPLVGPGRTACAGRGLALARRARAGVLPDRRTRSRCSTSTPSATGSASSRRRRATAAASSASPATAGSSTTSGRPPGASAGCPPWPRSAARSRSRCATGAARWCSCPRSSSSSSSWARRIASSPAGCCRCYPLLCLLAAYGAIVLAAR